MSLLSSTVERVLLAPATWLARYEHGHQREASHNERSVELAYVFGQIAQHMPKRVLDVGPGKSALPALIRNCGCVVDAIDHVRGYWPHGMTNRHYYVRRADVLKLETSTKYDMVTCVSTLEHIQDHAKAVASMASVLRPGGCLVLTCPHTQDTYIDNVYKMPGVSIGAKARYVTQSFSDREVSRWIEDSGLYIGLKRYWRCWTGDFWGDGKRIQPVLGRCGHQLICVTLVKGGA